MRRLKVYIPCDIPRTDKGWSEFDAILSAQFRAATTQGKFGTWTEPPELGITCTTTRLLDNGHLPLLIKRIVRRLVKTSCVHTRNVTLGKCSISQGDPPSITLELTGL